eukprot:CAMPEP_0184742306 /NCGR_PEP_ID=MMETSP0315-20130426/5267_1 /TAXON_ID=101924 /ORGANISM="Rhodosorus marinus, Strain UTEX LB 2760" /LENGTH=601 /DNA_ID=CAMNT_0027213059 /DNA_START=225 /DNA_END=2030 /DNA_ORIENTATION=-
MVKGVNANAGQLRRILVRSSEEGSCIRNFPAADGEGGELNFPEVKSELVVISQDGSKAICVNRDSEAIVLDTATGKEVSKFGKDISHVALSPLGSFALTWARYSTAPGENLCAWNVGTGEPLAKFSQKDYQPKKWPTIQWTDDESLAGRTVKNEVHFYDGDKVGNVKFKVAVPKVDCFAISRGHAPYRLATLAPDNSSEPGKLAIRKLPDGELVSTKSLFRAEAAQFSWSSTGSAALATVTNEEDPTGQSYYGETNLFFLDSSGNLDQRIELPRAGAIFDAKWAPRGNPQFIVVYGSQPARATLFNAKCEPVFDFGQGAWNCINFSPHGRFVALCGFQSLSGDVEVWDRNTEQLVGAAKMVHTTSFSWSPCSRYIIAATSFPRLRVDNGYRLYEYNGTLLETKDFDKYLLQCEFLPAASGVYPDRPASPRSLELAKKNAEGAKGGDASAKAQPYRPPAARQGADPLGFVRSRSVKVAPGKVDAAVWKSQKASKGAVVPGAPAEEPKALTASQKKNRRKKAKKQEQKASEEAEKLPNPTEGATGEGDDVTALQKRLRNLKKKLRKAQERKQNGDTAEQSEVAHSVGTIEKEIDDIEKKIAVM